MPREMQMRGAAQPSLFARLAGCWLACVALGSPCSPALAQPREPDCVSKNGELHSVVRVLDGETLVIDGGGEVRLIGALAPRAWDAASEGTDTPSS